MLDILKLCHQLLAVIMGQPGVHMMILGEQFPLLAEGARYNVEHASRERLRHFLRQERDTNALLKYDLAAVRFYFTGDEPHDRGLARAVPAHKTDALPTVNGQIDPFEKQRPAEADLDIL